MSLDVDNPHKDAPVLHQTPFIRKALEEFESPEVQYVVEIYSSLVKGPYGLVRLLIP